MTGDTAIAELRRGGRVESVHRGHAVVADATGRVLRAWGDPDAVIYPRSACKMIQALPLVESGAELSTEQLALACASHEAGRVHVEGVARWLDALGLADDDLRCGPQEPRDREARDALIRAGAAPCQIHNNCSGKHAGFLQLAQMLGGGPDYVEIGHPVQRAVRAAFEDVTGEPSPGWGIDGCSAPNFATRLSALARAMAAFAAAQGGTDARSRAMARLTAAMADRPDLVAGRGRACTELMEAMGGRAAIKTGAEGVFVAIVPETGLGVAVKITDGATRAAECAVARILVELGVLDAGHPAAHRRLNPPEINRRGLEVGELRPVFA